MIDLRTQNEATLNHMKEQLEKSPISDCVLAIVLKSAQYYARWLRLSQNQPLILPIPPSQICEFITDHMVVNGVPGSGYTEELRDALLAEGAIRKHGAPARNSILLHLSSLRYMHKYCGFANPLVHPEVALMRAKVRRVKSQPRCLPLTRDLLEKVVGSMNSSKIGVRDRAIFLFGWTSGGRTGREISEARMEDLRKVSDREFAISLPQATLTPARRKNTALFVKPVRGIGADALIDWLKIRGDAPGYLFVPLRRGCGVPVDKRLRVQAVAKIVRQRVKGAGVEGKFSAESLRRGFITQAAASGVRFDEAMALSGYVANRSNMEAYRGLRYQADGIGSGE